MAGSTKRSESSKPTEDSPFVPEGSNEPLVVKQLSPVLRTSSLFAALSFLALTLMVDRPEARRYGSTCLLISLGFHIFTIGVGVQFHIYYIYLMDHLNPKTRKNDYTSRFGAYLTLLTWCCCIGSISFTASIPIFFVEGHGEVYAPLVYVFFTTVILCMIVIWTDIYNYVRSFDSKMKMN